MYRDIILNTINAYPLIITLAAIFYSLVSLNLVGILFVFCNLLFGFTGNYYLKKISQYLFPHWKIFQRPNPPRIGCGIFPNCNNVYKTFRMPSGHAQIATLATTFWILYILNKKDTNNWLSYLSIAIFVAIAMLSNYSRIYIGCHNILQVTVGSFIGLLFGLFSYKIVSILYLRRENQVSDISVIQVGTVMILATSLFFWLIN